MDTLSLVLLVAATVTSGLLAGVFWLYSHTVMPALRPLNDRDFVLTFGALDRAIINPMFMLGGFLGAPLLTAAALVAVAGADAFPWVLAALVCHLLMAGITIVVNVPRNDALKAAGAADDIGDLDAVRAGFDEGRWLAWNHVRVALSIAALALLAWSLVLVAP